MRLLTWDVLAVNPKAIENVVVEDHKQQECGLQQGVMGLPEIRGQVR